MEKEFFCRKRKRKKIFGEGILVEEKTKRDGKDRISLEKGGGQNFTRPGLLNGPFLLTFLAAFALLGICPITKLKMSSIMRSKIKDQTDYLMSLHKQSNWNKYFVEILL